MATCRGQVTGVARLAESSCSIETPKAAQVSSWMSRTEGGARAQVGIEAGEHLLGERGGDRAAGERAERDDADQRALERADVGVDALGDELERAGLDVVELVLLHALAEDREPRLGVGGADVGHEAGLERSRSRSSSASMSRGRRSEVRTSWAPAPCSALKVWKNSCSVRALLARNWTSSTSRTSTWRYAALNASIVLWCSAPTKLVGERLGGRVEDGQPAAVLADVVRDRVERWVLPSPGEPQMKSGL